MLEYQNLALSSLSWKLCQGHVKQAHAVLNALRKRNVHVYVHVLHSCQFDLFCSQPTGTQFAAIRTLFICFLMLGIIHLVIFIFSRISIR